MYVCFLFIVDRTLSVAKDTFGAMSKVFVVTLYTYIV